MPPAAADHRGNQLALLAKLGHSMVTSQRIGELLEELHEGRSEKLIGNVREIRRVHDRAIRLPAELVEELAKVTSQAQGIWQQAKQDNNFAHSDLARTNSRAQAP